MKFGLRENKSRGCSEVFIEKTDQVVAINKNTDWQVESNSKVNSKVALHVFTSLQRSHDLSWGKGEKLVDFLNSGAKVDKETGYKDSKRDNDVLSYNEYSDTLRTSISNHLIASRHGDTWEFNSSATSIHEDTVFKAFLVAHATDFKLSPERMIDIVVNGAKIDRKNENSSLSM